MTFIHYNALSFALDLLSADLQHTNEANFLLALGFDANNLPCLDGIFFIGQLASWGCETGGHERRSREHETNGTAVDLDGWDGGGIAVDKTEMGDRRAVDGLEEEWFGVYRV